MNFFWETLLTPWSNPQQISWNLQIVIMGTMVCFSCGLVGTFVVIRRMALLGDAISHGILPGIVLAYLLTGSLDLGPMWIGACLAGLCCSFLIEWLRTKTRFGKMRRWTGFHLIFCPWDRSPKYPGQSCSFRSCLRSLW